MDPYGSQVLCLCGVYQKPPPPPPHNATEVPSGTPEQQPETVLAGHRHLSLS